VILSVCHVLRYTPWVKKVKEIIDAGTIGDVVSINHTEPVCNLQLRFKLIAFVRDCCCLLQML